MVDAFFYIYEVINIHIYAPDTIGHPGFSAETRLSGADDSFPLWISDMMEHYKLEKCAFIGPSYGGGIVLRLAAFMPDKIACSVLVSPAGMKLGSKMKMIQKILIPMILFQLTSSAKQLQKIADTMSLNTMKENDMNIIGDIFKRVDWSRICRSLQRMMNCLLTLLQQWL